MQILREVGLASYSRAVLETISPTSGRLQELRRFILADLTGPDCYWQPATPPPGIKTFFGRAFVIPFPFTLVLRFDDDCRRNVLVTAQDDLELYVRQNMSEPVRSARRVRLALRALDGCDVFAPFDRVETVGRRRIGRNGDLTLATTISYTYARLQIDHNSSVLWRGHNLSSGFRVALLYADGRGVRPDGRVAVKRRLLRTGDDLGLGDDFTLSPTIARLFRDNRALLEQRLGPTAQVLTEHREFYKNEAVDKACALSYGFLLNVSADDGQSPDQLRDTLENTELAAAVRALVDSYPATIRCLDERMRAINRTRTTQWWCVALGSSALIGQVPALGRPLAAQPRLDPSDAEGAPRVFAALPHVDRLSADGARRARVVPRRARALVARSAAALLLLRRHAQSHLCVRAP